MKLYRICTCVTTESTCLGMRWPNEFFFGNITTNPSRLQKILCLSINYFSIVSLESNIELLNFENSMLHYNNLAGKWADP